MWTGKGQFGITTEAPDFRLFKDIAENYPTMAIEKTGGRFGLRNIEFWPFAQPGRYVESIGHVTSDFGKRPHASGTNDYVHHLITPVRKILIAPACAGTCALRIPSLQG